MLSNAFLYTFKKYTHTRWDLVWSYESDTEQKQEAKRDAENV